VPSFVKKMPETTPIKDDLFVAKSWTFDLPNTKVKSFGFFIYLPIICHPTSMTEWVLSITIFQLRSDIVLASNHMSSLVERRKVKIRGDLCNTWCPVQDLISSDIDKTVVLVST
jgi:hypothetical protein